LPYLVLSAGNGLLASAVWQTALEERVELASQLVLSGLR
jgi:hypothetical protein